MAQRYIFFQSGIVINNGYITNMGLLTTINIVLFNSNLIYKYKGIASSTLMPFR